MPEELKTEEKATPNLDALATKVAAALAPSLTQLGDAIKAALANPQTVNVQPRVAATAIPDEEIQVRRAVVPQGTCDFDKKDIADFKFANLLIGKSTGDFRRHASLEIDMCAHAARFEAGNGLIPKGFSAITKDVASNPDPKGGFVIPAAVYAQELEPALREEITLWQLPIKKYTNLKASELRINRVTGEPTAYDYAGSVSSPTAVTSSDMTFDQVTLRPKSAVALTKIDMDMITDASVATEDMVREAIASQIGQKIEFNGYQGAGNNLAPQGIFDADSILTVDWSSTSLSAWGAYDLLSSHLNQLRINKTLKKKSNLVWVLPASAEHALRIMKDPTDASQPKARRLLSAKGDTDLLLGYPMVFSTNVPANKIMIGDWSKCVYAQWGGVFMTMDSLTVNGVFQVQVLSRTRYDWGCTQEKAFCQSVSLTGAP